MRIVNHKKLRPTVGVGLVRLVSACSQQGVRTGRVVIEHRQRESAHPEGSAFRADFEPSFGVSFQFATMPARLKANMNDEPLQQFSWDQWEAEEELESLGQSPGMSVRL